MSAHNRKLGLLVLEEADTGSGKSAISNIGSSSDTKNLKAHCDSLPERRYDIDFEAERTYNTRFEDWKAAEIYFEDLRASVEVEGWQLLAGWN